MKKRGGGLLSLSTHSTEHNRRVRARTSCTTFGSEFAHSIGTYGYGGPKVFINMWVGFYNKCIFCDAKKGLAYSRVDSPKNEIILRFDMELC